MSNLFPVAGCRMYIGGILEPGLTDFVEGDFDGQSWLEIDGWSQMGAFGDSAALISTDLINRGRTVKQKGVANAGQMENIFAVIPEDLGQIALIAAGQGGDKSNYAFKIEFNDTPDSGPAPEPSMAMFVALVMGTPRQGGEANTVRNLSATLEINSNIVFVEATEGS